MFILYFNKLYFRDYNGPDTCITYDAVNAAYLDARKRISKYLNMDYHSMVLDFHIYLYSYIFQKTSYIFQAIPLNKLQFIMMLTIAFHQVHYSTVRSTSSVFYKTGFFKLPAPTDNSPIGAICMTSSHSSFAFHFLFIVHASY